MKCANQPADVSMINVGNNALAASRDLFRRVCKNWESMRTSGLRPYIRLRGADRSRIVDAVLASEHVGRTVGVAVLPATQFSLQPHFALAIDAMYLEDTLAG